MTARVKARQDDPLAPARQDAYLAALESIPNLTVHLGHFLVSETRMPLVPVPARPPKTVLVTKTEEKGSDVNLATYLLADVFRADCEASVVITNDSDLAEPMRMVSQELGLTRVTTDADRHGFGRTNTEHFSTQSENSKCGSGLPRRLRDEEAA